MINNAVFSAAFASIIELRKLEVVSNNLANADTVGFKQDRVSFNKLLAYITDEDFSSNRDSLKSIYNLIRTSTDLRQSAIQLTDNQTDFAIDGDGLFVIQSEKGESYTRSGNFTLNAEGELVTADGHPVLGESGPITIEKGQKIEAREDGTLLVDGKEIAKLKIVLPTENQGMQKAGNGLLTGNTVPAAEASSEVQKFKVIHKALENSNVNVVSTMAELITIGRNFEAYQKVISTVDDLNKRSSDSLSAVA